MPLQASYFKRVFNFSFKARTSRGVMREKTSWFIKIYNSEEENVFGLGECGPLPGLSVDARPDIEEQLSLIIQNFNSRKFKDTSDLEIFTLIPIEFPSILFAFETALLDLANGGKRVIFENDFLKGEQIPINGLIWMGDMDFTMGQISIKIYDGHKCIKLKIGGLDFDRECDILNYVRQRYFRDNISMRLDANGAFKLDDVLFKLEQLAKYNIESIEQPIMAGLPEMEQVCRKSPIPIALDEELIGKLLPDEKQSLLERIHPRYIILKPMLHGGFRGTREWIEIADRMGIGWWITSSLESSIGLNAICQFTANYKLTTFQGLGTGKIYDNNFESPLEVKKGHIFYNKKEKWDEELDRL
jgi:O-succinylbenzoate synthase